MTTPSSYLLRAGHRPQPMDWVEPAPDSGRTLLARVQSDYEVYADISEFQPVIDDRYPYPICAFRLDTGWRTDRHAGQNWAWAAPRLASGRLALVFGYVVYLPGQNLDVVTRVKRLLGDTCPAGVVLQVDVESGDGFAGPGDHSVGANQLAADLAVYAGDPARAYAYANGYDYRACWPGIDTGLRRHIASYGSADPGGYGQQYYGGLDYPSPAGLPRTCPPFGGWVDLNVIRRPLATILRDFGISPAPATDWLAMATLDDLKALLEQYRAPAPEMRGAIARGGSLFVQFPRARKSPTAVYRYDGNGQLLWIPAPEYKAMVSRWGGGPYVVPLPTTSIFYAMPVVAGTVDPRK